MRFWFPAYLCLGFILFLLASEWSKFPQDSLLLTMFDVGQGEAILVETPYHQKILIDGGPNLSLLEHLGDELSFFDRSIDLLVLTHTDVDHLTAFPELLKRYTVKNVLMTGVWKETARYKAFLDSVEASDTRIILARADHDIDLGYGVMLDVLWPLEELFGEEVKDPNDASIVAMLTYNNHKILLTGDIEESIEVALLKKGYDLTADILKVPHHGSKTSSSTGFLLAVAPELALISAGRENRHGHPHQEVVERYASFNIPIRGTYDETNVHLVLE